MNRSNLEKVAVSITNWTIYAQNHQKSFQENCPQVVIFIDYERIFNQFLQLPRYIGLNTGSTGYLKMSILSLFNEHIRLREPILHL
jgi:hypothetical protein